MLSHKSLQLEMRKKLHVLAESGTIESAREFIARHSIVQLEEVEDGKSAIGYLTSIASNTISVLVNKRMDTFIIFNGFHDKSFKSIRVPEDPKEVLVKFRGSKCFIEAAREAVAAKEFQYDERVTFQFEETMRLTLIKLLVAAGIKAQIPHALKAVCINPGVNKLSFL